VETLSPTFRGCYYRTPLTVDYRAVIKDWLDKNLKDPHSAVVEYPYKPVQGWIRTAPIQGSQLIMGWKIPVRVNAKNSFGAYVGNRVYLFIFRDNRIVFEVDAESGMNTALLQPYE
jgi:hypothetical protein